MKHYDIVIIGGGAGGMTAAIYAKRANKSVLIIEKYFAGGQMLTIDKIANYPGFEMIDGFTLSQSMENQCKELGVEFANEEVVECKFGDEEHQVLTHKNQYSCRSIIIATGARPKQLKIENEKNFLGAGVSYCATCDGGFFQNEEVAVVGSIESAKKEVEYLVNICSKVYFITTGVGEIKHDKVVNITNSKVEKLIGESTLDKIEIFNLADETTKELAVKGLFVVLGKSPDVSIYNGQLELDKNGFIVVDEKMQTRVPRVFAIGDVRSGRLKQIVTACSDGAIAGTFA